MKNILKKQERNCPGYPTGAYLRARKYVHAHTLKQHVYILVAVKPIF